MEEMLQSKKDIASFTLDELKNEMKEIGEKPFRAGQIYEWLHKKLADRFDEMTNLSLSLREKLDQNYEIRKVEMVRRQISKSMGQTSSFSACRMATWWRAC